MMYSGDRRSSYQNKIGIGMMPDEFKKMIREGKITGHVGLEESIAMIAAALGWHACIIIDKIVRCLTSSTINFILDFTSA